MKCAMIASGSKGNCFLLSDKGVHILIDCGTSQRYIKTSLKSLGIEVEDIASVLITHSHSDHIQAIKLVKDLTVYSPVEITDIDSNLIVHDDEFMVEHLTITPIRLSHDAPNTTGYVISSDAERLVYITDTGFIPAEYAELTANADWYVIESNHDVSMLMETTRPMYLKQRILGDEGHLSNDACAEFLTSAVGDKTQHIFLAHISDEANSRRLCLRNALSALSVKSDELHPDLTITTTAPRKIILAGSWSEEIANTYISGTRLSEFIEATG